MKGNKKMVLHQVFDEIKAGLNPAQISKKYDIPKQTLNYTVGKLKKLGCVEKVGYGVWKAIKEVPIVPQGSTTGDTKSSDFSLKQIRGHAFIWKIEFVKPFDWFKIIKNYRKGLCFGLVCNKKVPRTILNNRKIWMTKKGLTIYEPLDFMGKSSYEVKGTAVYQMDRLIKDLLKEFGLKFRPYRFTTSREHYGMVKNELARQYNERKEKMIIRSEDGTAWLWIDDSKGLAELETGEPNTSRQVQKFYNEHKETKFKAGAKMTLNNQKEIANLKGVFPAMEEYNKNLKLHIKVQQESLKTQKETRELLKLIGRKVTK